MYTYQIVFIPFFTDWCSIAIILLLKIVPYWIFKTCIPCIYTEIILKMDLLGLKASLFLVIANLRHVRYF